MDDEEILKKVKNSLKLVKSKTKEVSNGINNPRIDFFEKQLWKITEELEHIYRIKQRLQVDVRTATYAYALQRLDEAIMSLR